MSYLQITGIGQGSAVSSVSGMGNMATDQGFKIFSNGEWRLAPAKVFHNGVWTEGAAIKIYNGTGWVAV